MSTNTAELLNDLSMVLVMLELSSPESLTELENSLRRVMNDPSTTPRIAQSARSLLQVRPDLTPERFQNMTQLFLQRAESFLLDPVHTTLLFEEDGDVVAYIEAAVKEPEFSNELDSSLIVEFIEKHASLLDELEANVTEFQFNPSPTNDDRENLNNATKRYIHTLKGDAGSVGLLGIERVCHAVEELAIPLSFSGMLEELLTLKEWCGAQLVALAEQRPGETSHDFLARLTPPTVASAPIQEHAPAGQLIELTPAMAVEMETTVAAPASSTSTAVETEAPYVNTELLAQLMGTPSPAAPADDAPYINLELLAELMAMGDRLDDGHDAKERKEEYPVGGEAELFLEFAAEAEDHLSSVENTILESEGTYSKDSIDLIFRGIHSIKGASSYFELLEVSESSHLTENLLDEVRSGIREFDQVLTDLVLTYADLQRRLLQGARKALEGGTLIRRTVEVDDYIRDLRAYAAGEGPPTTPSRAAPAASNAPASSVGSAPSAFASPARAAAPAAAEPAPADARGAEKLEVKSFVKVDTQRLDQLIDAIGEMCIYSSMLIQNTRAHLAGHESIIKITHQVEKFVRDLQNIGMSMRLIPIRGLFQKMSRLVWDTAKKINKDVRFEMTGEDTELDRTIIEKLADPLMHMVRNAVDHGIETPDERIAVGKSPTGTIMLSAYHAGGSIHVRLKDDGKGLDPQKLIAKAIEKGIIPPNTSLSRDEAFNLIFAPGFSTAAAVTDISGRGVGMDVVRRNIESMRGRVHIESHLGKGTTFTIELPLTLAIIDGIEVSVASERFIIPTLSVVEFMRPTTDMVTKTLDRGETFYFRGRYLPVYRLGDLFAIETERGRPADEIFIVVESGGEQATLVVDDIIGSYSTVIKGLGDMFSHVEGVAGCAIVSTGDVSLILDVRTLLTHARRSYSFERVMRKDGTSDQPALH